MAYEASGVDTRVSEQERTVTTEQLPRQRATRQAIGYTLLIGGVTLWGLVASLLAVALPVLY